MKHKRLLICITVFLAAFLCAGAAGVCAYSDDIFRSIEIYPNDNFYTEITDINGDTHAYGGIINAGSIENSTAADKIASYQVLCGGEAVISVTLNDIVPKRTIELFGEDGTKMSNGYYSVRFTLSAADNTECYLTGLSPDNLDTVQNELISAKLENSSFSMEDIDFIDAEKTAVSNDGDNELCWAAAAANTIHYTGWDQTADADSFKTPDDLLDLFRNEFDDAPGNTLFGFEWFFNGTYQPQSWPSWAHVRSFGSSGGYFTNYSSVSVSEYISTYDSHKKLNDVLDRLERGCGIGISLDWVNNNGERQGGHAITLWGYICDRDFPDSNAEHYTALIVSDSDSDQLSDSDRRTAPNKLSVLNMTPYTENGYDSWCFDVYGGVLEGFITLAPYSDDLERETDKSATLDKFSNPDLIVSKLYISNDRLDAGYNMNAFSPDDNIYIVPKFENLSPTAFEGGYDYTVTITNRSNSSVVFSKTYSVGNGIPGYSETVPQAAKGIDIGSLPVGEYTAAVTVNPNKTAAEAYFYNNTAVLDFNVAEAAYDLSEVSLSAQIGRFSGSKADASITCANLDTLGLSDGTLLTLMLSYYENDKWGEWNYIGSGASAPDTAAIDARGTKVKFRLVIETESADIPVVNIYSDEYPLLYTRLSAAADESGTSSPTPLGRGAKKLADGEKIAFTIRNTSSYDSGSVSFNAVVYAKRGNDTTELFRQDKLSLGFGESSDVISFDSWTADLSGTYELYCTAEGDFAAESVLLGTLKVEEAASYTVTMEADTVDAYDGYISLREAVAYLKDSGESDKITFDPGIMYIYIDSPITIDSAVTIDGADAPSGQSRGQVVLWGQGKTRIFDVTESGALNLFSLNLNSGYSADFGGSIKNTGGDVYAKSCIFPYSSSVTAGGAVYSDGGSVKLMNCSFKACRSALGGAVCTDGNAVLDMLNCNVFLSEGGAIRCSGGTAAIVYSTVVNNTSSDGAAAIASTGTANIIGSIVTLNSGTDIGGNTNVYGSYISYAEDGVIRDTATTIGSGLRPFRCDGAVVEWKSVIAPPTLTYKAYMSDLINEGIVVKTEDGKIMYSADGSDYTATGISSAFTNEEYAHDIFGSSHGRLFGSTAEVFGIADILSVSDTSADIYVPEAVNAVLIERCEEADGTLSAVNIYPAELEAGTNTLTLDLDESNHSMTYMLWNGTAGCMPICKPYLK